MPANHIKRMQQPANLTGVLKALPLENALTFVRKNSMVLRGVCKETKDYVDVNKANIIPPLMCLHFHCPTNVTVSRLDFTLGALRIWPDCKEIVEMGAGFLRSYFYAADCGMVYGHMSFDDTVQLHEDCDYLLQKGTDLVLCIVVSRNQENLPVVCDVCSVMKVFMTDVVPGNSCARTLVERGFVGVVAGVLARHGNKTAVLGSAVKVLPTLFAHETLDGVNFRSAAMAVLQNLWESPRDSHKMVHVMNMFSSKQVVQAYLSVLVEKNVVGAVFGVVRLHFQDKGVVVPGLELLSNMVYGQYEDVCRDSITAQLLQSVDTLRKCVKLFAFDMKAYGVLIQLCKTLGVSARVTPFNQPYFEVFYYPPSEVMSVVHETVLTPPL